MGARGPKKKPHALRLLQGTEKKSSKKDPRPESAIPSCPSFLNAVAKREWKRVTKELNAIGLISNLDRSMLAGYCTAWARFVEAEQAMQKIGSPLIKTSAGYIQLSPYLTIANRALDQIRRFGASLGLSPADRVGLGEASGNKPKTKSEKATAFFGH